MKLARRFWLFGALVPVVLMGLAFHFAGIVLERSLERALDDALLAQASVESVSLFDGATEVHLHMEHSALLEQVRPFAPVASVYGPDGTIDLVFPARAPVPAIQMPLETLDRPVLRHEDGRRVLLMSLRSPRSGAVHTLRLDADRSGIAHTLSRYRMAAGSVTALLALALGLFQARQARSLGNRVASLVAYLRQVGAGDLTAAPPGDGPGDEIDDLRRETVAAATELRRTRDARERLVANAAHELRTPLASMRTALDLALRRERSVAELRQALEETREEVDRLALLSSRLLDLSALRLRESERGEVDLGELARASMAAIRGSAADREVELVFEGEAPSVSGDAAALRRAVDNILDNAIKFSPRGGRVHILLDSTAEAVRLTVADEGPGVPPAEREAVFEPFHRAALQVPGTGLGLALVREIAESHGGSARFEGSGPGARLVLELPRRS